ncbi:MAG: NUDIX domain-containing protein [Nocardioidaceae bacterium]
MTRLRAAARALVVDPDDRILLCRFDLADQGVVVWTAPGGGVEPGETVLDALRRELVEEIGLAVDGDPPHVWHQVVVAPGHAAGFDGVVNDYFLVRTEVFEPRGSFDPAALADEGITRFAWWTVQELLDHDGPDLLGPCDLPRLLVDLLHAGPPATPHDLGL